MWCPSPAFRRATPFCHQLRRHGYEVQAGWPGYGHSGGGGPLSGAQDVRHQGGQRPPGAGGQRRLPNAFTSNAITGYYFESTEKFEENLRILLSFVSIPYFTKESVDKEQGIIGQEIGMIEDDPDWVVFMDLMQALYEKHPVRVSVAGSAESISHITAETLYACHKAFYDPPIWCCAWQGTWTRRRSARRPGRSCRSGLEHRLPGGLRRPGARGGVPAHDPAGDGGLGPPVPAGIQGGGGPGGRGALRQQLLGELACEALLGNSGPLYARLYREGLVNRNFSYGYESYPGCAFLCAGGRARTRRECGRRWPPRRSGSHGRDRPRAVGAAEKNPPTETGCGR